MNFDFVPDALLDADMSHEALGVAVRWLRQRQTGSTATLCEVAEAETRAGRLSSGWEHDLPQQWREAGFTPEEIGGGDR